MAWTALTKVRSTLSRTIIFINSPNHVCDDFIQSKTKENTP